MNQLFPLGRTLITPGAIDALAEVYGDKAAPATSALLWRHASGDWGQVRPEDRKANADALKQGLRLLSSYSLLPHPEETSGPTLWIITEADRSATTILLPDEY